MAEDRTQEMTAAVAAVRAASQVTRAVQRSLITEDTLQKKDKSPVTVADFASQAVVCRALAAAFPEDPIVGEEDAHELRTPEQATLRESVVRQVRTAIADTRGAGEQDVLAWIDHGNGQAGPRGRFWTLDPIDGTKGFLRCEQYAIALALIEDGELVLGVLGCPNLSTTVDGDEHAERGLLLTAVRGQGAQMLPLNGEGLGIASRVRVSEATNPANARFCESVESGHSDQDQSLAIAAQLGITQPPVRMDSQAKYATVARGEASIYLRLPTRADYREKIWDHAAGALVVAEAGGRVTDIAGEPLNFGRGRELTANRGIIATNGQIHEAVVAAVRQVLG